MSADPDTIAPRRRRDVSFVNPLPRPEMTIRVYNTLSKTKEDFEPIRAGHVGMYLCGPTVYAESHIGHMVGPVIFDTVKRYLVHRGYNVNWIVNITDVDDKLIAAAKSRGVAMSQIATEMTADYMANLRALGVDQINQMPRATDHMDGILEFITDLIDKGFAYEAEGDVFFDVLKDPAYGELSNRSVDAQQGEGGEAAARKRSNGDFALWKSAKVDEPAWDSPWGPGRPGWHIECSAMSHAILGETFDIHGGGLDLMFPHHENERAQSSCRHGQPMVKYWMHNGLMSAGKGKVGGRSDRDSADASDAAGGKISRSKGDGGLSETIARHTGERIRFFLLRTHYRSTILYSEETLEEAGVALESFYRFFERFGEITGHSFHDLPTSFDPTPSKDDAGLAGELAEIDRKFHAAMDDDFNTGAAISHLFDLVKSLNRFADAKQLAAGEKIDLDHATGDVALFIGGSHLLRALANLLGLFGRPVAGGGGDESAAKLLDDTVQLLIDLRREARERKDYATGDAIRDRLAAIGVALLDKKEGTSWQRVCPPGIRRAANWIPREFAAPVARRQSAPHPGDRPRSKHHRLRRR